jgi:hypothetical protein
VCLSGCGAHLCSFAGCCNLLVRSAGGIIRHRNSSSGELIGRAWTPAHHASLSSSFLLSPPLFDLLFALLSEIPIQLLRWGSSEPGEPSEPTLNRVPALSDRTRPLLVLSLLSRRPRSLPVSGDGLRRRFGCAVRRVSPICAAIMRIQCRLSASSCDLAI